MPPSLLAGIDIGGTNLRCALAGLDDPSRIVARGAAKIPASSEPERIAELIETLVDDLLRPEGGRAALAGAGSTAPGMTDPAAGRVLLAANLTGWRDVPLAALLRSRFGVPVRIENDVRAAAYGEFTHGAGRGRTSLVYLTVSTGVAAGIIADGRILRGHRQSAGEIGFFLPDPAHIGGDWGENGCLELTAGGIGLARAWAAHTGAPDRPDTALAVFAAARAGDPEAGALVRRAADYLAQAAVALCTVVDPEILVLGGGVAANEPLVFDRIREVVGRTLLEPPPVVHAALGEDAPLVGALSLAAEEVHPKFEVERKAP